jgi:S1-C subfamily serine protease
LSLTLIDPIKAVMELLYGADAVSSEKVYELQQRFGAENVNHAIEKLRKADLLALSLTGTALSRTGPGLKSFVRGTYLALSLGYQYIVQSSAPAIVHVIVEGSRAPEAASTGFYCREAGGRIVTAGHTVLRRRILRVESFEGQVLHAEPIEVLATADGLDLAILDPVPPEGTPVLSLDLEQDEIIELERLYVAGYPQVPRQNVSLTWCSGELRSKSSDFKRRSSYLISNVTSRGFSGGPAISERGCVIGVVAGEPDDPSSTAESDAAEEERSGADGFGAYDSRYSVLTPAFYILEVLSPGSYSTLAG